MFTHKAPNGLRLNKSIKNKNSRVIRALAFLKGVSYANKESLVGHLRGNTTGIRVSGWGSYLFTAMLRNGMITSFRQGRRVTYCITDVGRRILDCHDFSYMTNEGE